MHHNVQGLHSKVLDISNYEEMHADALMINETWLKTQYGNATFNMDNYAFYRQDRPDNKGRGGVAVYVRQPLVTNKLETNVTDIEHVAVDVTSDIGMKCVIVSIYKSPAQNMETFLSNLCCLLNFIGTTQYDSTVVARDFNENLLNDSKHHIHDIFTQEYNYIHVCNISLWILT